MGCSNTVWPHRPDIVAIEKKEKVCKIIDIAVPGDSIIDDRGAQKVFLKYQDLEREFRRLWDMRKVLVIPVVVGVLGCVTKDLGKWIDRLGITVSTAFLQKTTLLGIGYWREC